MSSWGTLRHRLKQDKFGQKFPELGKALTIDYNTLKPTLVTFISYLLLLLIETTQLCVACKISIYIFDVQFLHHKSPNHLMGKPKKTIWFLYVYLYSSMFIYTSLCLYIHMYVYLYISVFIYT